jgi:hypothetical protein
MEIQVNPALIDVTDRDLDNLTDALDQIDEACLQVKTRLQEELFVKAEQRAQWWERFLDYCHTGK